MPVKVCTEVSLLTMGVAMNGIQGNTSGVVEIVNIVKYEVSGLISNPIAPPTPVSSA